MIVIDGQNTGCCFLEQAMLPEGFPFHQFIIIGAALKCAPIMEWEFILASGRSSF